MRRKPMDPAIREQVMSRDNGWCERCGIRPATECHHRLYRSRGGTDDPLNLAALCQPCHMGCHASSEAPWVVSGYIDKDGRYVGDDADYLSHYGDGRRAA